MAEKHDAQQKQQVLPQQKAVTAAAQAAAQAATKATTSNSSGSGVPCRRCCTHGVFRKEIAHCQFVTNKLLDASACTAPASERAFVSPNRRPAAHSNCDHENFRSRTSGADTGNSMPSRATVDNVCVC